MDSVICLGGGRVVRYNCGTGGSMDDTLGRVVSITDDGAAETYAEYGYLGAGTIVSVAHPDVEDGLTLDYDADGDNSYAAWDRFGRGIEQKWTNAAATAVLDHYTYTYDMSGSRVTRANELNADLSEAYGYDELDRLIDADRGGQDLQEWSLDALGNWSNWQADEDGDGTYDLDQDREHNAANEITEIDGGGWADPSHDAAGNMIRMPSALNEADTHHAVYDAWNRMTAVWLDDGDGTFEPTGENADALIATYEHDGQRRRIVSQVAQAFLPAGQPHDLTDFYYNESWQVLEERGTDTAAEPVDPSQTQYIWDLRYIDSVVVRFYDSNTDGDYLDAGDNVLYYSNDANFNVTSLVDPATGNVAERYCYTPYGKATILNGAQSADPDVDGQNVLEWSEDDDHVTDVANELLYDGYRRDPATGLCQVRNRVYHAALGRWTVRDIARPSDGTNLYQFGASAPVGRLDPTGLESACPFQPPLPDPAPGGQQPNPYPTPCRPPYRLPPDPVDPHSPNYVPRYRYWREALSDLCNCTCLGIEKDSPLLRECKQEADTIYDAYMEMVDAWRKVHVNVTIKKIIGWLVPPAHDDHVYGAYCYEWAKMTYDAVTAAAPRPRFFTIKLVGWVAEDTNKLQHSWVAITAYPTRLVPKASDPTAPSLINKTWNCTTYLDPHAGGGYPRVYTHNEHVMLAHYGVPTNFVYDKLDLNDLTAIGHPVSAGGAIDLTTWQNYAFPGSTAD